MVPHPSSSSPTSTTVPFPSSSSSPRSSRPTGGSGPLFLGLDVGLERLSATLLDSELKVVDELVVEMDAVLPNLTTRRGIYQQPGDEVVQPIELVVASLDKVLELMGNRNDLSRVVAVGGSSHTSLVLLTSNFPFTLSSLLPHLSFHAQLFSSFSTNPNPSFVLQTFPTPLDTSTLASLSYLNVSSPPSSSSGRPLLQTPAVQLLKLPWKDADLVRSVGSFVAGLFCGKVVGEEGSSVEGEWGMWDGEGETGTWDEDVLGSISISAGMQWNGSNGGGGGSTLSAELKSKLGEVEFDGGRAVGNVSSFLVERFGFAESCVVLPITTSHLATYLSLRPNSDDAVLVLDSIDALLIPSKDRRPSYHYQLYPHPAQKPEEVRKWIVGVSNRNGDSARTFVRDFYSNSNWSVMNSLVAVVPPGGSSGLDSKLFSFVYPSLEVHPFGIARGVMRFENGVHHDEYRDLRANPRCLIESQFLAFRTRYSSIRTHLNSPPGTLLPVSPPRTALGCGFEPFSTKVLPRRLLLAGQLVESPACLSVLADVFNTPVFSRSRHPTLSAAALGSAYKARWAYLRLSEPNSPLSFEEAINALLSSPSSPPTQSTSVLQRACSSTNLNPAGAGGSPIARPTLRLTPSRLNMNDAFASPSSSSSQEPNSTRSRTSTASGGSGFDSTASYSATSGGETVGGGGAGDETTGGLIQLAQPDRDAYRAYCSMIPEWLRLEEIFVKGLLN